MYLKVFRAVWFISTLVVLTVLLLIYASLPETVMLQDDGDSVLTISREIFFYTTLVSIAVINALAFVASKLVAEKILFRTWFYGMLTTLNLFFCIALSYIDLFNNGEKFDYGRIGFIIYGSVGLVVIWALSWPIVRFIWKDKV
jgi:hypothetical protein